MRNAFCGAMVALAAERSLLFFTGDLGFAALEPLQATLGPRFVNAGVAEQNMVSVAAGAASLGEQCWVYSIAPFAYARPFEQIRNDACLHDFDVKIVGNGGGYGYGVMGATHHAIEDYGVLCALQHMRAFVPAFAADVAPIVRRMADDRHPGYLRLGRDEMPAGLDLPDYAAVRRLLPGEAGVLIAVGAGAGGLLALLAEMEPAARPDFWVISELPILPDNLPQALRDAIEATGRLAVWEEHVAQGGVGQMLTHALMLCGTMVPHFSHFHAQGYLSGRYGSQAFHRVENGLDAASVIKAVTA